MENNNTKKIRVLKTLVVPLGDKETSSGIASKIVYLDTSSNYKTEVLDENDLTEAEDLVLKQFQEDFDIGYNNMNQSFPEFWDKTLIQMIDICADKYNVKVNRKKRSKVEEDGANDWMFNLKHPITHNKIITIVSNIINQNKGITFQAFNESDEIDLNTSEAFHRMFRNLQKASGSRHEFEEMHNALNAAIFPASIQKFVYNPDYSDLWNSGAYMKQVPLQNIYIDNIYQRDIQSQRFVIENYSVPYGSLKRMFPNNPRLKLVNPSNFTRYTSQTYIYEKNRLIHNSKNQSEDTKRVVLQEYYNKSTKTFALFANGVLLETKEFKRKSYPYRKTIFREFANTDFFYGMSLTQLLLPSQLTFDTLMNNYLNNEILNSNPSWLVTGENIDDIDGAFNMPNQVIVGSGISDVKALRPAVNTNGLQNAAMIEKGIFNESSSDELSGGNAQKYVSARGSIIAQNNFATIMGYFNRQVTTALIDYAYIAMEEILSKLSFKDLDSMGVPVYQSLFLDNDKEVMFDLRAIGTEDELIDKSMEILLKSKKTGRSIISVNPEIVKTYRYRIYPVVETEYEGTPAEKEARMINRWNLLRQMYQFDAEKLNQINKAFSSILFKGVEIPKGLFDKAPIVPGIGERTGGGYASNTYNQEQEQLNTASFDAVNTSPNENGRPA